MLQPTKRFIITCNVPGLIEVKHLDAQLVVDAADQINRDTVKYDPIEQIIMRKDGAHLITSEHFDTQEVLQELRDLLIIESEPIPESSKEDN